MVGRVSSELGRIDILVNNAGINIRKAPPNLELEEWKSVIDTNLTSAFLCSKAVHPTMKAAVMATLKIPSCKGVEPRFWKHGDSPFSKGCHCRQAI